jgi:hypothetical protein
MIDSSFLLVETEIRVQIEPDFETESHRANGREKKTGKKKGITGAKAAPIGKGRCAAG